MIPENWNKRTAAWVIRPDLAGRSRQPVPRGSVDVSERDQPNWIQVRQWCRRST
jgi:hypothetical protein